MQGSRFGDFADLVFRDEGLRVCQRVWMGFEGFALRLLKFDFGVWLWDYMGPPNKWKHLRLGPIMSRNLVLKSCRCGSLVVVLGRIAAAARRTSRSISQPTAQETDKNPGRLRPGLPVILTRALLCLHSPNQLSWHSCFTRMPSNALF